MRARTQDFTRLKPDLALRLLSKGLFYIRAMIGCIFITTLFLLADVTASILVLICVVFSLVDVGGFMHFWGLTIDTVSCNNLIIAIGLCVSTYHQAI